MIRTRHGTRSRLSPVPTVRRRAKEGDPKCRLKASQWKLHSGISRPEQDEVAKSLGFPGVTDQGRLGTLYLALIAVLAVIALMAGIGAFVLASADNDSAGTFMAVVTTIVGGLVGIFAPSPVANGNANN